MAVLGRVLRIDTETEALSGGLRLWSELEKLRRGIKDDVVRVVNQLCHLIFPVRGTEYMHFFSRHLLCPEPRLVETARLGPREMRGEDRIEVIVTEGLLREEDPAAGPLREGTQDLSIGLKLCFVEQIARGRQRMKGRRGHATDRRKRRTGVRCRRGCRIRC